MKHEKLFIDNTIEQTFPGLYLEKIRPTKILEKDIPK